MLAMVDWLRSTPLICARPAVVRMPLNFSSVNSSLRGSGPSRAMPGIVEATARGLASLGYTVCAAARRVERMESFTALLPGSALRPT